MRATLFCFGFLLPSACEFDNPITEKTLNEGTIEDTAAVEPGGSHCDFIFLLETQKDWSNRYVSDLWKFKPSDSTIYPLGSIDCDLSPGDLLSAMTADQDGTLYMLSLFGSIFRFNPQTMECSLTGLVAKDTVSGLYAYSLAFMREDANSSDTLYLGSFYGDPPYGSNPTQSVLSTIDESGIETIGTVEGLTGLSATTEIAGTSDGRLFMQSFGNNSQFLEVDPYSGEIAQQWDLDINVSGYGFTFALWENDVWFFPSSSSGYTQLYRFDMQNESAELIDSFPQTMVGAAAPTCASSNAGG